MSTHFYTATTCACIFTQGMNTTKRTETVMLHSAEEVNTYFNDDEKIVTGVERVSETSLMLQYKTKKTHCRSTKSLSLLVAIQTTSFARRRLLDGIYQIESGLDASQKLPNVSVQNCALRHILYMDTVCIHSPCHPRF